MLHRLFFVLPDEAHALAVLRDIETAGIAQNHIHVVPGRGTTITQLPLATVRQQHDIGERVEKTIWVTNLVLFLIAFAAFLWAFYVMHIGGMVAMGAIMVLCVVGGAWFAMRVPNTHLAECKQALMHGEIVMMVDVPKRRAEEIGDIVERHHPEAVRGGTGWTIEALGI